MYFPDNRDIDYRATNPSEGVAEAFLRIGIVVSQKQIQLESKKVP